MTIKNKNHFLFFPKSQIRQSASSS